MKEKDDNNLKREKELRKGLKELQEKNKALEKVLKKLDEFEKKNIENNTK